MASKARVSSRAEEVGARQAHRRAKTVTDKAAADSEVDDNSSVEEAVSSSGAAALQRKNEVNELNE
jgi:hypothetical protein